MPLIEKNETSAVSADNKPSTGRFDYFSLDRLLSDRDTSLSWAMVGAFIDQTVVSPLAKTLGETRAVITASPLSAATAGIFFLSGLAALVYQVVWQRVLTQAIGVDSVSIAFIVTIFMIGLGFGSLAGGAVTAKARKHLVLVYAIIELLIGAYGLISIPVLRQVNAVVAGWGVHSVFIDFGVNALALMLPIFLMGMTTPIIVDFIKSSLNRLGHTIGVFYGINVLGAASGALLTLFFIELFGLQGCTLLAASINIMLGIGFFVLAGAFKQHQTVKHAEPDNQQETQLAANQKGAVRLSTPLSWQVIASAFLFGFVTLSLQMVFFRILYSFFSPISYVFPVMLSSYLLLMASGQIVAGHAVDTMAAHLRPRMLVYLLLGGAVSSLAVLSIPVAWLDNLYWTITWPVMIFYLVPAMLLSAVMMLPIAFFSGYLPVVSRLITDDIRFAGVNFGKILFWSTMGNIVGTFLTAIVLFDVLGSLSTLCFTLVLCLLGVYLLFTKLEGGTLRRPANLIKLSVAVVAVVVLLIPKDYYRQDFGAARKYDPYMGSHRAYDVIEGHTAMTPVFFNGLTKKRFEIRPFNAGAAAAIIDQHSAFYQYYSLAALQIMDAGFRPKRILQIGLGAGEFPYVTKELDFMEKFVMVELSPEVLKAYEKYSDPLIAQTLTHPKVEIHATDGRRYVQNALKRGEQFDLIQVGILGLSRAGASNIYSREFFGKLEKLLKPNGYLALEPYIGVVRLGYERFDYGYAMPGSSWLFMNKQPLSVKDGQRVAIDEYQLRQYQAKSYEDMHTELIHQDERCVELPIQMLEFNKQEVLDRYPNMYGTDDRLLFEYFYLRELSPDFVWHTRLVQSLDNLSQKPISITAQVKGCPPKTAETPPKHS